MKLRSCFYISLIILGVSTGCLTVFAQDATNPLVTLAIPEPRVLPGTPLYPFKNFIREVRVIFILNPVKKAELRLQFADEKLIELYTLAEKSARKEALEKALENYLTAQKRLRARLEALKGKNKNVDELLKKLERQVHTHTELFETLAGKLGSDRVKKAEEEIKISEKKALELDTKKQKTDQIEDATVCIELYDPVCGVDGKIYSNDCFAHADGVAIRHAGECKEPVPKPKLPDLPVKKPVPPDKTEPTPIPKNPLPPPPPATPLPKPPPGTLPTQPPPAETTPQSTEPTIISIEADDYGFYPSNIITVPKGLKVSITFVVRSGTVYYGGLDFRSTKFQTPIAPPGGTVSTEFIADEPFIITSYWPATGVKKAELKVETR